MKFAAGSLVIAAVLWDEQGHAFSPPPILNQLDCYQAELLEQVNIFDENNRGLLTVRFKDYPLSSDPTLPKDLLAPVVFVPNNHLEHTLDRLKNDMKYVGEDKREYLDNPNSRLDLTPEERNRIRKVTGIISCPDSKGGQWEASASLLGKGDEIVTAAHIFEDGYSGIFHTSDLSTCTFTNFDSPPAKSRLAITKSHEGLMIGWKFPKERNNDYAYAKLQKPIVTAVPFPIDLSDTIIHNYKENILVSGLQDDRVMHNRTQPIVEPCEVEESAFTGYVTAYFNDCTTFGGAS